MYFTEYFGASDQADVGTVLCSRSNCTFNSLGTIIPPAPDNPSRVVKFFSHAPLSSQLLADVFTRHAVLHEINFNAYPVFTPPEQFAPFEVLQHALICEERVIVFSIHSDDRCFRVCLYDCDGVAFQKLPFCTAHLHRCYVC